MPCFVMWYIPFLIGAFSDWYLPTTSGVIIHEIYQYSIIAAAITALLIAIVLAILLRHGRLFILLWVFMIGDFESMMFREKRNDSLSLFYLGMFCGVITLAAMHVNEIKKYLTSGDERDGIKFSAREFFKTYRFPLTVFVLFILFVNYMAKNQ